MLKFVDEITVLSWLYISPILGRLEVLPRNFGVTPFFYGSYTKWDFFRDNLILDKKKTTLFCSQSNIYQFRLPPQKM